LLGITWLAVDIGAVEGSNVDYLELVTIDAEFCVTTRNRDIIQEDVCFWVTTSGGWWLVEQEASTRIRPTFYNEQGLTFWQVICACSGGIGASSSSVLHFFEQVRAETRCGFNLGSWSASVLGHDVYLRLSGQSRQHCFTNFIIATFSHPARRR